MVDERQHNGSPTTVPPGILTGVGDIDRRAPSTGSDAGPPLLAANGTPRLPHIAYDEDGYPYDDGEPLAQSQQQMNELLLAFTALEPLLAERFTDAFLGCDMFIYEKRGDDGVAPDIFIAFGADTGRKNRLSYKIFEGEPVPSFVLEVLSNSTADQDLGPKRDIYAAMGIAEYWLFDPGGGDIPDLPVRIAGHRLVDGAYQRITPLPDGRGCRSDALGLEMRAEDGNLRFRDLETGVDLPHFREERARRVAAEDRAEAAEDRARAAEDRAEAEAAARKAAETELARLRRLHGEHRTGS